MIPRHVVAPLVLLCGCLSAPASLPAPIRFDGAIAADRVLSTFAVSRDGRWLAYSAEGDADRRRRIFIRSLRSASEPDLELPGTLGGRHPFFSPDSTSLGFFAGGGLWRVNIDGRTDPQRIADAPVDSAGATWTDDNRIVFAPLGNQGLMQISLSEGSAPEPLTSLNQPELAHGWPHALSGQALVFTVSQRGRDPHVEVLSAKRERSRLRIPVAGQAQFLRPGYLAYGYLGNLMAVKFDAEQLELRGVPVVVARNLQTADGFGTLGRTGFAASENGTLVWLRAGSDDAKSRLVNVSRDGSYTVLSAPADVYQTPRISPDGRRLAVVVRPGVMTREIRVLDMAHPERILFALRGGDNQSPAWMDNRRLTFASNRDGAQTIYVTASGRQARPLFSAAVAAPRNPAGWSRSARRLALYELDPVRRRDVLVYRVGESIAPVMATNANERSPVLSADGKWIAFVSDASGRDEVYIKLVDGSTEPRRLTTAGAEEPVWTRAGLYYRDGDRMMLSTFESGTPSEGRAVFEGHFERDPGANAAAYDVDARGNFIMLKSAATPRELRVVQNWATELVNQLGIP